MTVTEGAVDVATARVSDEILAGGVPPEDRRRRLDAGGAELSTGGGRSVLQHERFLVAVAGALVSLGIVLILLGWYGSAHAVVEVKQTPYLISGGLLGLALCTVGAVAYFTHWISVLVRDVRRQEAARARDHEQLLEAVQAQRAVEHAELLEAIRGLRGGVDPATPPRPARHAPVRAPSS